MTVWAVALLLTQDRTAIKETLPNGATVYVGKLDTPGRVAVCVAASSIGRPELPETHGVRHLVEHLMAKGDGSIDSTLEAVGATLTAETTRDTVSFSLSGPAGELQLLLNMAKTLFEVRTYTQADIEKEARIVAEEMALLPYYFELAGAGWDRIYAKSELDPFGDPVKLGAMSPGTIELSQKVAMNPKGLCLAVVGDLDTETVYLRAKSMMAPFSTIDTEPFNRTRGEAPVLIGTDSGEGVGQPMDPFPKTQNLESLAAGLGIRAWTPGTDLVFTVSPRAGVMVVGSSGSWTRRTANALRGRESEVAVLGQKILKTYLRSLQDDPSKLAKVTATVLPFFPSFDPMSLGGLGDGTDVDRVKAHVTSIVKVVSQ